LRFLVGDGGVLTKDYILNLIGNGHQTTSLVDKWAASGAEFQTWFRAKDCTPEFKRPLSNLTCCDKDPRADYICFRDAWAVSLSELFLHYMHETPFENLINAFMMCPILIAERYMDGVGFRGSMAGRRIGHAASSVKGGR
jgi:hypothetical protein